MVCRQHLLGGQGRRGQSRRHGRGCLARVQGVALQKGVHGICAAAAYCRCDSDCTPLLRRRLPLLLLSALRYFRHDQPNGL
jgi:hypothetical protein